MARMRSIKNHFVACLGEFVGTFLFLFFAFAGTQIANLSSSTSTTGPDLQQLMYISLIFGFSLAVNVWVFFRISGGLFNPAVTLALCVTGVVPFIRSVFIFVAQILGGIAAAAVVRGIIPGNEVRFNTQLSNGASVAQGLFLEMFLTTELVFTILMLAAEKTKATFVAPVGIGLALFVAELVGVYWTGGSLNPARSFGPDVVRGQFQGSHWIYWLGPVLGALLASAFYKLLKFLNYEEVNGDQDKSADEEKGEEVQKQSYDNRDSKTFDRSSGRGGSQRSPRSANGHRSHGDQRDGYGSSRNSQSPNHTSSTARQSYPPQTQYNQNPRDAQNQPRKSGDSQFRQSKAFAPTPAPLRYEDQRYGDYNQPDDTDVAPAQVLGPDGRPYVQDGDAQNRQLRRKSVVIRDEDARRSGSKRNRDVRR